MTDEIMVSVSCIAYNHERFIAQALDSFVMQETDFNYEILIHDDASPDKTQEIIKEYEAKYPDLIKPIYQTENQYSKGLHVSKFNLQRARGKYIAVCEGDDYWLDPQKLRKQVRYMEENPGCSMCVHAALNVTENNEVLSSVLRPNHGDKVFTADEVIEGGGGLFPTNSALYPSEFALNRPAYYEKAPVGDYPLAIYLATQGHVFYMDEFMSVYRVGVQGSYMDKLTSSSEKITRHYDAIEAMLDGVNDATNYIYNDSIIKTKRFNKFNVLLSQEKYKELQSVEYKEHYDKMHKAIKAKIFIKMHFPLLARVAKKLKKLVHNG